MPMKVSKRHTTITTNADYELGAKHLYLLDFNESNLPALKSTIESTYPETKVRFAALLYKVFE